MDELTLDGETYVSSKRAAKITGYAKDYIGQLCREGRVKARQVGRNWYVLESSIREHRFGDDLRDKAESKTPKVTSGHWEQPKYSSESVSTLQTTEKVLREAEPVSYILQEKHEIRSEMSVFPQFDSQINTATVTSTVNQLAADSFAGATQIPTAHALSKEITDSTVKEMHSVWKDWFDHKESGLSAAPMEEIMSEDTKTSDIRETTTDSEHEVENLAEESVPVRIIKATESPQETLEEESSPIHMDKIQSASNERFEASSQRREPSSIHRSYYAPPPTRQSRAFDSAKGYVDSTWESKLNEIGSYYPGADSVGRRKDLVVKKTSILWGSILIMISILSIAVAVVGSGYADPFLTKSAQKYLPIQYLVGESSLKKPIN